MKVLLAGLLCVGLQLQAQSVTVAPAVYSGSGLNDATISGGYLPAAAGNHQYEAKICATGTPDTAQFARDGGMATSCTPVTGAAQYLSYPAGTVSAATWTAGRITFTTSTPHGLVTGALATVGGTAPSGYSVTALAVRVTGATTFSVTQATNPGKWKTGGVVTGSDGLKIAFMHTKGHAAEDVWKVVAETHGSVNAQTFMPRGIGAVPRTIEARLRETASLGDFGAKCDGVTDDTAAVQRAFDSAFQLRMKLTGVVGNCVVSQIEIKPRQVSNPLTTAFDGAAGFEFAGLGQNATVFKTSLMNGVFMDVNNVGGTFAHLHDFSIIGPGSGTADGIHNDASNNVAIDHVTVWQMGHDGIHLQGCGATCLVDTSDVSYNLHDGIFLDATSDASVTNSFILLNGHDDIELLDGDHALISNNVLNVVDSSWSGVPSSLVGQYAIYNSGATGTTVVGNRIEFDGTYSWTVSGCSWSASVETCAINSTSTLSTGDLMSVAGVTPGGYNNSGCVATIVNGTHFSCNVSSANPGSYGSGGIATMVAGSHGILDSSDHDVYIGNFFSHTDVRAAGSPNHFVRLDTYPSAYAPAGQVIDAYPTATMMSRVYNPASGKTIQALVQANVTPASGDEVNIGSGSQVPFQLVYNYLATDPAARVQVARSDGRHFTVQVPGQFQTWMSNYAGPGGLNIVSLAPNFTSSYPYTSRNIYSRPTITGIAAGEWIHFDAEDPNLVSGATLAIQTGLRCGTLSAGSAVNHCLDSSVNANGTSNYFLFHSGTAPSYLHGPFTSDGPITGGSYYSGAVAGISYSVALPGCTLTYTTGLFTSHSGPGCASGFNAISALTGGVSATGPSGGGSAVASLNLSGGAGIAISGTYNGTVSLRRSGVTAGSYGDGADIPQITVDAYGRVTSVDTTPVHGCTGHTAISPALCTNAGCTTTTTITYVSSVTCP